MILLYALLAAEPSFSLRGDFESAVVSNSLREGGGNELHVGSWYLNMIGDFQWRWAKLAVDWAEPVLNFGDEDERNSHNQNWLRADGYVSRPTFTPILTIDAGSGCSASAGVQRTGLSQLSSSQCYMLTPATCLHSQHYDKGFSARYENSWLSCDVAVVDGDWAIGQADVLAFSDSRANSTPGVMGSFEVRVPDSPWYFGGYGNLGDIGSYPGQKRRQDSGVVYAGIALGRTEPQVDLRGHFAYMARSPAGDGSGDHVPAVETVGGGVEVRLAHQFLDGRLAEYLAVYTLANRDDQLDGEIWVTGEARRLAGVLAEVSWQYEMLRVFLGTHLLLFDKPVYGDETQIVVVGGVGVKW